MRKLLYLCLLPLMFVSCDSNDDDNTPTGPTIKADSVVMGAGYANDIYFSLENGIVSTPERTSWDIAFYTDPRTSTIITNDGTGTKLYVYPNGDMDAWDKVDTANMSTWTPLFNTYADSTWENGAFDKGALGHPDYGWCIYDNISHNLLGDSIHIVVLADKSVKKLFIEKREAATNSFVFKYANIDGTDESTTTLVASSYLDKNLIHFSLSENKVVDQEPASADWDLLFTKYYDESIPYIVTGVLTNNGIGVAAMPEADTASNDYATANYAYAINTIGAGWKSFNMETFQYDIAPNLFYIKDKNNKHYKIVFTGFDYTNGTFNYVKTTY